MEKKRGGRKRNQQPPPSHIHKMAEQKGRKELMWRADLANASTSPKKGKKRDGKLPKEIQKIKDQVFFFFFFFYLSVFFSFLCLLFSI